jgi:hypothetical protein
MSVNDPVRVKLRVQSWDADNSRGILEDQHGFCYPMTMAQLGPEFVLYHQESESWLKAF